MKALDFELGLIFVIIFEFCIDVSRETILDTCLILLLLLVVHYCYKNRGDLFE